MADLVKTRWLLMRPSLFAQSNYAHTTIGLSMPGTGVHIPPIPQRYRPHTSNRGSYIQFTNDNEIKHAIPRWQSIHPTDHLSDEQREYSMTVGTTTLH